VECEETLQCHLRADERLQRRLGDQMEGDAGSRLSSLVRNVEGAIGIFQGA
jgi:hypothetical protein